MKLTIIMKDDSHTIECEEVQLKGDFLHVFQNTRKPVTYSEDVPGFSEPDNNPDKIVLKQIWNMNNIIGVEMD